MTKHVLDRARNPSAMRLERFIALERDGRPNPASQQLQQRKRTPNASKLAIYADIQRRGDN